jgi:8-oxo-dGTP diphosphatase
MESRSGSFEADDEVDQVVWLTPSAAAARLAYDRDREVLRSLTGDH